MKYYDIDYDRQDGGTMTRNTKMKDLQPYAGDLDKYLYSLLELLRTKYYNVSVNRGSKEVTFFYKIHLNMPPIYFTIPNGELLGYYMNSEIPKEIKMLIEEK